MTRTLSLLHPFMPFVTEEIWQSLPHEGEALIRAPWPVYDEALAFPAEEKEMERVMDAIRAIRNDEIAASAAGINTSYYKVLTFSFSAFFAGVAGALYACANASLSTSSFSFTNGGILNSTFVVVMVVLGGMGSLTGSIFSAVIMYVLNYQIKNGAWVSALPGFLQGVFTYPMLVYALVLVVIIIFRPKGIFGSYEFSLTGLASSLAAKLRGSKKSAAKEAAQHE